MALYARLADLADANEGRRTMELAHDAGSVLDGLFEVIERTLNPRRKRTPTPSSKRVTRRKPKALARAKHRKPKARPRTKKRPASKAAPKAMMAERKPRSKPKTGKRKR